MFVFVLLASCTTVNAATRSIYYKRGIFLLWSETSIIWTYNGSKITDSACDQDSGFVAPNLIEEKGVTKYAYGGTSHYRYTSKYKVGAGVPTPWGTVFAYSYTENDVGHIYASGHSYWEE